jgi:hypothetical protein
MKLKKREQEVIAAIKYAKQLRNERECPCPLSAKFGAFGYTHIGANMKKKGKKEKKRRIDFISQLILAAILSFSQNLSISPIRLSLIPMSTYLLC